jgi:hypothetical protein
MGSRVDRTRSVWTQPTGDSLQADLEAITKQLMRDSLALGKTARSTKDYKQRRDQLAQSWSRYNGIIAQLRAATVKETKRATRDSIHSKLCEIIRKAESDKSMNSAPPIVWKQQITSVIDWLDTWTG